MAVRLLLPLLLSLAGCGGGGAAAAGSGSFGLPLPNLEALAQRDASAPVRFVKVPKTASTSVQVELRTLGVDVGNTGQGEDCYHVGFAPGGFNLVYLRSPRMQALSMFLECRYSNWARKRTSENFNAWRVDSDAVVFGRWVDYFADYVVNATTVARASQLGMAHVWLDDFNCYNPISLVTRQLGPRKTCIRLPHHWYHTTYPPPNGFLETAVEHLSTFSFVGIGELFDLSFCLLTTQLRLATPPGCFAASQTLGEPPRNVTTAFVRHGRRPSAEQCAPLVAEAVWSQVDRLFALDAQLYVAGLRRLLSEAEAYQATAPPDRRLSPHLLPYESLMAKLAYLIKPQDGFPASFSL
jgi:hypothetical protein